MGERIPPQRYFFYQSPWNSQIDKDFLSILIEHKPTVPPADDFIPAQGLLMAAGTLNERYELRLQWEDVSHRYKFLKERYETFKEMNRIDGVHWDWNENYVHASEETWFRIIVWKDLCRAYYHEGEPEFQSLCVLFDFDDIKNEGSKSIIQISEDTKKEASKSIIYISEDECSEEITSPPISSRRRQLFHNSSDSNVLHMRNLFQRKPKENTRDHSEHSHGQSSCASSSPMKWSK